MRAAFPTQSPSIAFTRSYLHAATASEARRVARNACVACGRLRHGDRSTSVEGHLDRVKYWRRVWTASPKKMVLSSLHFTTLGRTKLTPTFPHALHMDSVRVTAEAPLESCSLCHTTFSGTTQFCRRGTCRVEYLRRV
ncbi:hypothetical protein V5799_032712 [Amblyomma americanum]|uniref:Uncharacterized protein n=1 Tax=Amblyomma americanum TaxID=6943 RepID=A0AAQ4DQD9_AMBAM